MKTNIKNEKSNNFLEFYKTMILGPQNPNQEFILSGHSYGEIYKLAAGIKNHFTSKKADEFLCLCTDNKAIILAALLASIAGGPTIILPYSYNNRVIKEMRRAIGFFRVLTDLPENMPGEIEVITPDQCRDTGTDLSILRDPDSIFLKLFTGGSTGKPKVLSKTPRNMLSEALYLSNKFNISENDLLVSTAPPRHIYGLLFSVLIPFISSAKILENICVFPQEILSSIENHSATILVSIPMHYRVLRGSAFNLPTLKSAFSSGGKLDDPDAKFFYSRTGFGIIEVFGSTETGGIASRCNTGTGGAWEPFDKIDWKIINGRLNVQSEFISPDIPKDRAEFYETGDRAEYKDDNSFTLLGRADGIVKVAGKRVDLMDVQNRLKQIAGIDDVIIISLPVSGGRENEIAALIEGKIDQAKVRQSASQLLESYALPRRIRIVDKIPIMSTGKYNRREIELLLKSEKK